MITLKMPGQVKEIKPDGWAELSHEERELTERLLQAMLEAALPLQAGLDQEVTLQALIRAAEMLKNRLRVGSDIKRFIRQKTGKGRFGDVANSVTAGFARR